MKAEGGHYGAVMTQPTNQADFKIEKVAVLVQGNNGKVYQVQLKKDNEEMILRTVKELEGNVSIFQQPIPNMFFGSKEEYERKQKEEQNRQANGSGGGHLEVSKGDAEA